MKREILKDQLLLKSSISENGDNTHKSSIPQMKGILYEKFDDGYGNSILKKIGENTVVVGGAIEALEHLINIDANWKPKTLNEIYNINASVSGDNMSSYIALFGAGVGGSSLTFGALAEKDIKRRDVPDLIPLRVNSALTGVDASKYYFKKDNEDGTYSWYLKEFATTPVIKTCWKDSADDEVDGTEVTDEIYDSKRTEGLQTFAEFTLDFNTKDVREYYESTGSLSTARYNSIGLYIGQKKQLPNGDTDYVNVRLFSYLNIDNKSVRIKVASQYIYRVLSLV